MSGSVYGTIFKISTWGESHGAGVGVVVDGCPAGLPLNEEDIQKYLDRRKPGQSKFTTARSEGDKAEILSGVFEGKTTGTPISIVIRNTDQRSRDYSNIMDVYRPGHADYTFDEKYGFRDYRGGGRSSGRETIGRVAAVAENNTGIEIEPLFEEQVDFDTFSKSDFRVVKVKNCEAVPKSKKLLRFTLDDGTENERTILSGVHAFYEPEELVGKTLLAIVNLPPRSMMGIDSCGMLLSAIHNVNGEEKLNLVMLDDAIPAGAKLY